MTPSAQARQALKSALNGQEYDNGGDGICAGPDAAGDIVLSREAARLINAMLTRAHYEGELEKEK